MGSRIERCFGGSKGRGFCRRGEGSAPNSPPVRFSLGFARIFFGFRSLDFLWVSFEGMRRARVSSPRGGFGAILFAVGRVRRNSFGPGQGSFGADGEGVVAAGRVRRRTLLQRKIFLVLVQLCKSDTFVIFLCSQEVHSGVQVLIHVIGKTLSTQLYEPFLMVPKSLLALFSSLFFVYTR